MNWRDYYSDSCESVSLAEQSNWSMSLVCVRYDAPEYEVPRNKLRYRSRFMRHRDGDDSDGDSRSTVRFTSTPQESSGLRERVLDTEDAARGPLSGIFRLTDSPRVMKKLQECERAGKRKKEDPASQTAQQPQTPKPQVRLACFWKSCVLVWRCSKLGWIEYLIHNFYDKNSCINAIFFIYIFEVNFTN